MCQRLEVCLEPLPPFPHRAHNSQKHSLIQMFQQKQAQWTALDEIAQLSNYRYSSHTLWYLLAFGSSQYHASDLSGEFQTHLHACYCRGRIDRLIKLDIMGIVARVLSILYDIQRKGLLLDQRGGRAQSLLDLLQAVSPCLPYVVFRQLKQIPRIHSFSTLPTLAFQSARLSPARCSNWRKGRLFIQCVCISRGSPWRMITRFIAEDSGKSFGAV